MSATAAKPEWANISDDHLNVVIFRVKLSIITVASKSPSWVVDACDDYLKRFPHDMKIDIVTLPLGKRGKNPDIARIVRDEGRRILDSVPDDTLLVALDVLGQHRSTAAFAGLLDGWIHDNQDIAIVIGGPDGLSDEVLSSSRVKLSLSAMTFPHMLVKVIILEQLYRAWSILNHHPYHRE